jgi:hypothetical protein
MDLALLLLTLLGIIVILLWTQYWFRVVVFGIAGLGFGFATIASIIHFQIVGALGCYFLMVCCWRIAGTDQRS